MPDGRDMAGDVRAVLRPLLPASWRDDPLADETDLLDGGVGLDSSAALEVLLACEHAFDAALPAERLLGLPRLTVGALVAEVRSAADDPGRSPR